MAYVLGLIPARGGSRGIKNKNIIEVGGKPLISYVIAALKRAKLVDKIVVSTNSEEIAAVAKKWGAEVPFMRPDELAQDDSPTYPAVAHAIKKLEELQAYRPDYIVTAQPTFPLLQPEHIDAAVRLAMDKQADSVITTCLLPHACHPYNIREMAPDGTVKFWKEVEHYQFPTRQMKPKFYTIGNLFVSSYNTIIEKGRLEGKKNYSVEIDRLYHSEVDNVEDLPEVERLLKTLN